jgi:phage/plasmid-like protein (TIGR03299 family)
MGVHMAHELHYNNNTGNYSMMYVGEPPWHGLGTKLNKPATASEAIKAAHLNWKVAKLPVCVFNNGDQTTFRIKNRYAIVKEGDGNSMVPTIFGLVSEQYSPLQNSAAFEFFDPIVGKDAAIYHTAGALFNGERIWILAKLPGCIRVVGDDITDKYLLLSNSHDGRSAIRITFTPIRVVCNNTLTQALSMSRVIRVAHTRSMSERLKQAEELLNIVNANFETVASIFSKMSTIRIDKNRLDQYLKHVFPDTKSGRNREQNPRIIKTRAWAEYFFDNGAGNQIKGVSGTLWAAYNGVTEYIDHCLGKQDSNARLNSIWFGEGRSIKVRAYSEAKRLMHSWRN